MKRQVAGLVVLVLALGACAPGAGSVPTAPGQAVGPSASTAVPVAPATPWPTLEPLATETPVTSWPESTASPTDEPEATDVPEATYAPEPTERPEPGMSLRVAGLGGGQMTLPIEEGDHRSVKVILKVANLQRSRCRLVHTFVPDAPGATSAKERLEPLRRQLVALHDGLHTFRATCPSWRGDLKRTVKILAADGKPEQCRDFTFPSGPVSVFTLEALRAGMVGTWAGCVSSPYAPTYRVTMTFRADGTYSATSDEVLDGQAIEAMYWFPDRGSGDKRYELESLSDAGEGSGNIDLVDASGGVLRAGLQAVRLMGDRLSFDHLSPYGWGVPLFTFRLDRQ